jgi:hypothetical protein
MVWTEAGPNPEPKNSNAMVEQTPAFAEALPTLDTMSDEQLLDLRICDLPIHLDGTWLQARVEQLHQELKARNILFQPQCYLADEWLTPEGEPVIGIPFYLAHPRLIALEKKMMMEAEGETDAWCMQLLRHEAGHALSYAYDLNRKRNWQKVFGKPSEPYGDTYRFKPYSKSFVHHLDNYYAQYHPDEDFVETFAVWLTPGLDWRREYEGWKALDKLLFVDKLMKGIAGKPPVKARGKKLWNAAKMRSTLRRYYQKRRHDEAENRPEFHDQNLKRMFPLVAEKKDVRPAVATLIQAHKKELATAVADWTGERKYMLNEVIKAVHQRSKALKLVTAEPESVAVLKLATYLTTLLMNYRHTNRLRGKK